MTAAEIVRHVPPGFDLRQLADADQVGVVNVIFSAIRAERDKQRELLERMPKINTESVSDDIRYKLGSIAGLSAVLDMPRTAKLMAKTAKE